MTDAALLRAAIDAAATVGIVDPRDGRTPTARGFARRVLGVDVSTVQRWEAGEREMPGPARQLCRAIVARPRLVRDIELVPATAE